MPVLGAATLATKAYVDSAITGGATPYVTISTQAGTSYTPVLTDGATDIEFSNAAAITVTVPPNSSVAFPVGTVIALRQVAAGQVTATAGVGVTLRAANGAKTSRQWATMVLLKRGTDEWIVSGDVTT